MNIDNCVHESLNNLFPQEFDNGQKNTEVSVDECQLFMWPQIWMDSSCGHGMDDMMCCPVVTTATCLVVVGPMGDACVYHNLKFAYKIDAPSEAFWHGIKDHNLPGAVEILNGYACLEKEVAV